jgi:hypothetical protein
MMESNAIGEEIIVPPFGYAGQGIRWTIWIWPRSDDSRPALSTSTENHIVPVMSFPTRGTNGLTKEIDDAKKFCDVPFGTQIDAIESVDCAIAVYGILQSPFLWVIDLPLNAEGHRGIGAKIVAEVFDLLWKEKKIIVHKKEVFSIVLFRKKKPHLARCWLGLLYNDDARIGEMYPISDMDRWIVVTENNFLDGRCFEKCSADFLHILRPLVAEKNRHKFR